jgi:choline transport protein
LVFLLFTGVFALNASQQTASRLVFAFARDDALVFSKHIGTIHCGLGVPVYALFFNAFVVFVIGCIYLGSTTAFSAIIGTGLVLQQLSFAFPAALLMYQGRSAEFLPVKGTAGGKWNLGAFGWFFNFVTVAWALLSTVLFSMPLALPVSGVTMNYTSAVLGAMALFSIVNWFVYARRHYKGPRIDIKRFGEVLGN